MFCIQILSNVKVFPPLTARKEKSRFNSNRLGQIPCYCCDWAGQLFDIIKFDEQALFLVNLF